MSARTDSDYVTLIEAMPPGAVLTLQGVTWDEYEDLLRRFDERPGIRFTYDHGRLQIMTASKEHEGKAGLFPLLLFALAEKCGLNYLSLKSMTMRKREKLRGLEPDDCFYFRKLIRTAGTGTFNPSVDPPPELAIEVDVTSGSMSKFHIFATLGVRELWRHDGKRIHFYRLIKDQYTEITHSDLFPFLTPEVVSRFLRKGEAAGGVPMVKAFRTWLRVHGPRTTRRKKLSARTGERK